ncbi:DUF5677 domain-containing protein [Bacillus tropicus]|uniref:DUF5677 domain-containing protein n=1 Tax=Bacillus cereus group TaxID=86661 RepID=UPI001CFD9938|nr:MULTISPECIES: DUF5677 domain-containing protein [Bacillus cereus group]MCB4848514.1 DUF5677 domain-containing protein [Bacillus tropicus]
MNNNFPTYTKIFETTQRRLKSIKKTGSRNKELDEADKLMFYLVGNINLRINTIFHLLKNDITDGVLPLQRTLFELQIAFEAFINAEDKERFVKFFNEKKNFETGNKLDRFLQSNNENLNIATPEEIELLSKLNDTSKEQMKSESLRGMSIYKQWYEIASGKTLMALSAEFQELTYYHCYDEPSNWVHSQRIHENMDIETFSQQMPNRFYVIILNNIYWSIDKLSHNIAFLANYYNIKESNPLFEYGVKLVDLKNQFEFLIENRNQ